MNDPAVLTIRNLAKRFGGSVALDSIDIDVTQGTLHAVLGGNGSGKSTMVKILAGVYPADAGTIAAAGNAFDARSFGPDKAWQAGLRFVHQDLGLFETLSVAENMALAWGFPRASHRGIAWRRLHRRVGEVLEQHEIAASASTPVGQLRPATRTMVAIARAMAGTAEADNVLVLDEPTAALADREASSLLDAVRRRVSEGQAVILISHRLREVTAVADDITVLRDGRVAGTLARGQADDRSIVRLMAGETAGDLYARAAGHAVPGTERLRVQGLAAGPLTGIDLSARAGEVVGLAGLRGSGRSSVLRSIFGDLRRSAGPIMVDGVFADCGNPASAMRSGIAYVPEDRGGEAAFATLDLADNISAAVLGSYWRRGWMRRRLERADTSQLARDFRIKASAPTAAFYSLSGGNQQKAILARWLRRRPAVLLLDEPTQGVDVVARAEIYRLVRQAAADGCAVVVASSDLDELATVADRVIVLREGAVAGEIAGAGLTERRIAELVHAGAAAPAPGGRP